LNFRDGDQQSKKEYKIASESTKDVKKMYNSPNNSVTVDSLGKMVRITDKSNKRTTLIDDKTRVYKGGSWRDRAYWLDPAQRRYFPQDMATDYIGFRCAMSKVGSKSQNKKRPRN
jgi:gliding motility-associated lipoprotein GldJ